MRVKAQALRPHDRLELGFEAPPIEVSVLLDLIDLIDRCFAHDEPIDRAACPPHVPIGYTPHAKAGSPVVTKH